MYLCSKLLRLSAAFSAAFIVAGPLIARPLSSKAYRNQPLRFEANQGQIGPGTQFVSHGSGYELALTSSEATLALPHASVRMKLAGANAAAVPAGLDQAPGKVNYYIGKDPAKL